jgi:hypothetical protein
MKTFNIAPFEIIIRQVVTSVVVEVAHLDLFNSVHLRIIMRDSNNVDIKLEIVTLSGDDYKNWSSDDNYLINYIKQKYGFMDLPINTNNSSEQTPSVEETPSSDEAPIENDATPLSEQTPSSEEASIENEPTPLSE